MDIYKMNQYFQITLQGKCAIHVEKIDGDYNNVVGLPITRIYQELKKIGIDIYVW